MKNNGKLFVISGPSGVGKGTLIVQLIEQVPDLYLSISATTRSKRLNEKDGVDYYFLTEEEFLKKQKKNEFLEFAKVHGYYYGTFHETVKDKLNNGISVILEIDVQGALEVKKKISEAILIFIMPPSMEELENRLRNRSTETEEALKNRIEIAKEEVGYVYEYKYVIVNDNLYNAACELAEVIKKEKF
jgi:guanylate kinase